MKVIDYEKTKGTFILGYLEDKYIYEGTINIDENSISKELEIFKKIIEYEEGEIFTLNGSEIKILSKNIDIAYREMIENKSNNHFNKDRFMNLKYAKKLSDDLIYFHIYYKPYQYKIPDTFSHMIINGLKRYPLYAYDETVVKDYLNLKSRLKNVLLYKYGFYNTDTVLVSIPSHNESCINNNAVSIMINEICKNSSLIDGSQVLLRTKTILPQKMAGKREKSVHFNTIKVNSEIIKNKTVILIDDITTSGNSIEYCRDLLLYSGARKVYCFAFAKTN